MLYNTLEHIAHPAATATTTLIDTEECLHGTEQRTEVKHFKALHWLWQINGGEFMNKQYIAVGCKDGKTVQVFLTTDSIQAANYLCIRKYQDLGLYPTQNEFVKLCKFFGFKVVKIIDGLNFTYMEFKDNG